MAIRVPTTWKGNLIFYFLKFLTLISCLGIVIKLDELYFKIDNSLFLWIPIILLIFLAFRFVFPFLDGLSAFTYIILILRTPVDFNYAYRYRFIFVPNSSGKWYPLKQIKNVPYQERKKLFQTEVLKIVKNSSK